MAGVFDLKKGAFDSSEAGVLHEAYAIALQGLRTTQGIDRVAVNRLARSIVKVARTEPDCLRNDGTIDPIRLAQRAVLRMLQMSAPRLGIDVQGDESKPRLLDRISQRAAPATSPAEIAASGPDSAAKVMMRLFDRTPFAKL